MKTELSREYGMVKEFHIAFGLDVDAVWSPHLLRLRNRLITEEYNELMEESRAQEFVGEKYLKESCDLVYVLLGTAVSLGLPHLSGGRSGAIRVINQLHKILNVDTPEVRETLSKDVWRTCEVVGGTVNALFNDRFEEAFRRVHESNMSKLTNGKVSRREDGKVLKGPDYKPCDLGDLV